MHRTSPPANITQLRTCCSCRSQSESECTQCSQSESKCTQCSQSESIEMSFTAASTSFTLRSTAEISHKDASTSQQPRRSRSFKPSSTTADMSHMDVYPSGHPTPHMSNWHSKSISSSKTFRGGHTSTEDPAAWDMSRASLSSSSSNTLPSTLPKDWRRSSGAACTHIFVRPNVTCVCVCVCVCVCGQWGLHAHIY
jgi:hypothetical protein